MSADITYERELDYLELLQTGIGKVSMPTTSGIMSAEEIEEYTEELMHSVDLYGADNIRKPSASGKVYSVIGKTRSLIDTAISSDAAKSFGEKMRDWNDRMEEKEKQQGKRGESFFPR